MLDNPFHQECKVKLGLNKLRSLATSHASQIKQMQDHNTKESEPQICLDNALIHHLRDYDIRYMSLDKVSE
ncbi:unnamed protein product [Sphenostylis stenocarpa]|uniref:Uncharacterized protein n=1 Tax=Sphenostylis stenocarpa TaxID=92480 RepID=A0AA86RZI8_9FABA|nr:unnamed protein product [Sphenostylis stenocarpa]